MKKIQLILAVLAFATASFGVYATEVLVDTIYYEQTSPMTPCGSPIPLPCVEGIGPECKTATDALVWKRVNDGPCEQVFKQLQ